MVSKLRTPQSEYVYVFAKVRDNTNVLGTPVRGFTALVD
jgi:hypothetical protein